MNGGADDCEREKVEGREVLAAPSIMYDETCLSICHQNRETLGLKRPPPIVWLKHKRIILHTHASSACSR